MLPSDPTVAPVHAEIVYENDLFQIRSRDGAVIVRRDGAELNNLSQILTPGDRIVLGDTRMIFRNVEGKKS